MSFLWALWLRITALLTIGKRNMEKDAFQEASQLLETCREELDALHLDTDHDVQVLASVLYARAIHLFTGLIPLLRAGQVYPARVVARALLEAVFTGVALVRDDRTLLRYVASSEVNRLKWIDALLDSPTIHIRGMTRAQLRTLKEEVQSNVERFDLKDLNVEDLARWAKMHDTYLREYALWSLTAHASERDFKDCFTVDDRGNLTSVDLHYTPEESLPMLSTCGLAFLKLHQAIGELFSIDAGEVETRFEPLFEVLQSRFAAQDGGGSRDEGT